MFAVRPRTTFSSQGYHRKRAPRGAGLQIPHVGQAHEKAKKIDLMGINRGFSADDNKNWPLNRDGRGRFALEPTHLRLSSEDARRQGCEKMRVSNHWGSDLENAAAAGSLCATRAKPKIRQ